MAATVALDAASLDALTDLVLNAPGPTAPAIALELLRELATDGDAGAALAMTRVLAAELGTPSAATTDELLTAADVPGFLKLYALAWTPSRLLASTQAAQWALDSNVLDFARFQALVERDAPTGVEVLRAYVLCGFAMMFDPQGPFEELAAEARIATLDQIRADVRIVEGDAADATFDFGRAVLLGASSVRSLMFVINHELGHHVDNAAHAGTPALPPTPNVDASAPTIYGVTARGAWTDWQRGAAIAGGASVKPDELADTFALAVRIGSPDLLAFTIRTQVDAVKAAHPRPATLGGSMLAVYDGASTTYMGPTVDGLADVLAILQQAGYAVDGPAAPDGRTLLTDAVGRSARLTRQVLAAGADPNATGAHGATPLTLAARRADIDTVQALLDAGAQPNTRDDRGWAALHEAAWRGSAELTTLLAEHGADVAAVTSDGENPLGLARSPAVVDALVAAHADLAARNNVGETALHAAAARADAACVQALLDAGADPHATNDRGETPLLYAATTGHVPVVLALLAAGARPDDDSDDGVTPLMAAAGNAQADAVRALLDHGADVNAAALDGRTALMLASNGRLKWNRDLSTTDRMCAAITVLADAGAHLDATDDAGRTALMWAVTGFDAKPVERLLDRGADPRIAASDGRAPIDIARAQDHSRMVELLEAARARLDGVPL